MADHDKDFRPPVRRQEPRRFEPPPWEREAFEKRKQEAEPATESPATVSPAEESAPTSETRVQAEQKEPLTGSEVEEKVMLEMLAGLAAEEPDSSGAIKTVAFAAALLLVVLGGVLIVWGVAALVSSAATGAVGTVGGSVMLLFGSGFIGAAIWLTIRTLRQQGVL